MDNRFLRPLLIFEFLIAIDAIFTVWSAVGGQYHLDLMFWPWKLGIGMASAGLIVAITANLVRNDGRITRRILLFCALLIAIFALAGVVTYYYHLNEPVEQEEDQDDDALTKSAGDKITSGTWGTFGMSPGAAGFSVADHGQPLLTAERFLEFGHVRHGSVHAETRDGVRVGLGVQALHFRSGVFTPDLAETKEELLLFVVSAELG
jgi:hypothetical protein